VPLASLTLKDLDKLIDPHRNAKLYNAIGERLEAHGGKSDKAFPADYPLRKPDTEGNPTGPVVRTVTMVIDKLSGIPVRGGIAKNDSMLRVDVFTKAGKFHLVPVYVHHRVTGLPNRAIVAHKLENEWTVIDETFEFIASLHSNEFVRVKLQDHNHLGYFAGCDRSDGKIGLWAHDRDTTVGANGLIRIACKTAKGIEKLHVDVRAIGLRPDCPESELLHQAPIRRRPTRTPSRLSICCRRRLPYIGFSVKSSSSRLSRSSSSCDSGLGR
jgi:CRISPR-associated endonuclease Csn1